MFQLPRDGAVSALTFAMLRGGASNSLTYLLVPLLKLKHTFAFCIKQSILVWQPDKPGFSTVTYCLWHLRLVPSLYYFSHSLKVMVNVTYFSRPHKYCSITYISIMENNRHSPILLHQLLPSKSFNSSYILLSNFSPMSLLTK